MCIWGTEHSSVILSQRGGLKSWKVMTKKCQKQAEAKRDAVITNKPTKLQLQSVLNTENCDALQTLPFLNRIKLTTCIHHF